MGVDSALIVDERGEFPRSLFEQAPNGLALFAGVVPKTDIGGCLGERVRLSTSGRWSRGRRKAGHRVPVPSRRGAPAERKGIRPVRILPFELVSTDGGAAPASDCTGHPTR